MGLKAALTGGTGFVGGHLVDALRADDVEVCCLVRDRSRAAAIGKLGGAVVEGTLQDKTALRRWADGAQVVFHVAGSVDARDEDEFLRVNREGTRAVVEAAQQASVARIVYVSSLSVTGPSRRGTPVSTATPPRPISAYGRSKLAGEQRVREGGTPFTIVRPPSVYGARDRQFLRLFRAARRGLLPLLAPEQELSFVYAADLARALIVAGTCEATAGRVYHVAHPEIVTQRRFLAAVGESIGRRPWLLEVPPVAVRAALRVSGTAARIVGRHTVLSPQKGPELLAEGWTCETGEFARDTGWRAPTALPEGLAATARWYEAKGWL